MGDFSDPVSYQALQHFITHSPWETPPVWARVRRLIPIRTGVLALDDTSFPKQGQQSVGVKRQYCGALGKIANCQVAVSTALVGDDSRVAAHLRAVSPEGLVCRRRPARQNADSRTGALSGEMAHRPGAHSPSAQGGVPAPRRGGGRRLRLDRRLSRRPRTLGLRYGVAIRWYLTMWTPGARRAKTAGEIAAAIPNPQWQRVCWGEGTKGPLVARFAAMRVRPAKSRGERWLLCERSLVDDERKYYVLNLDAAASLRDLVTLVRSRWPIEQQYRELKDELGLDHFEGRSYPGWAHHTVLTAIAFTFLQLERRRSGDAPRPTLPHVRFWVREIMALLYVVHNRKLLNLLVSFQRNPPLRR